MAFIGRTRSAASGDAAEHKRYYAHLHVLVDPGEPLDLDVHAGLFEDLAVYTFLERLAQFQHPAGRLPLAVVAAPDDEHTVVLIEYDSCDADGVAGRSVTGATRLPIVTGRGDPVRSRRRVSCPGGGLAF